MSWQEIDRLLQKLFDTDFKDQQKVNEDIEDQKIGQLFPSEPFKDWLDKHIQEKKFMETRMVCLYCGEKIDDDKYVVVCDLEHVGNFLQQVYFHSKGKCNPRHRFIKQRREIWLRDYNYKVQKKKNDKKSFLSLIR